MMTRVQRRRSTKLACVHMYINELMCCTYTTEYVHRWAFAVHSHSLKNVFDNNKKLVAIDSLRLVVTIHETLMMIISTDNSNNINRNNNVQNTCVWCWSSFVHETQLLSDRRCVRKSEGDKWRRKKYSEKNSFRLSLISFRTQIVECNFTSLFRFVCVSRSLSLSISLLLCCSVVCIRRVSGNWCCFLEI